jgi:hypothetical protein
MILATFFITPSFTSYYDLGEIIEDFDSKNKDDEYGVNMPRLLIVIITPRQNPISTTSGRNALKCLYG